MESGCREEHPIATNVDVESQTRSPSFSQSKCLESLTETRYYTSSRLFSSILVSRNDRYGGLRVGLGKKQKKMVA